MYTKGARTVPKTRRQNLILNGKKIIAFLQNGKKVTDCKGNMTDVTSKVSCKVEHNQAYFAFI